jgi:hypothetical protein
MVPVKTVQSLLDYFRGLTLRALRTWGLALLPLALAGCGDDPSTLEDAPVLAVPDPAGSLLGVVQQLELETLPGPIRTYFSPGSGERAEQLQAWLRDADAFFRNQLKIAPPFHLAVLNEEHWAAVSPGPYGVPFVTFDDPSLVVMPALPERSAVTQIYNAVRVGLPPGAAADLGRIGVSYEEAVEGIVDLIGFHEVGHVYVAALGYHPDNTAPWLMEMLATYAAYSYLDIAQPSSIVVWNALSEALLGVVEPASRNLDEFNALYADILRVWGPATYGWFQSHFNLRDDLIVRQRPRGTWFRQLAGTGLDQDTRDMPTSELLRRLQGFEPGFVEWAESVGLEY